MPNEKTDSQGFSTLNTDKERNASAVGDTTTTIGTPGDKHTAAANTADTATLLAAKSKKPENGDNVGEKDNSNA